MFTGLVKEIGTIKAINSNREGKEFIIKAKNLACDLSIDDSIAVNGVCQTITNIYNDTFKVQAVHGTLEKSTLGQLAVNQKVNLELALRPFDRLGGHFVYGHVNGIGKITSIKSIGKNYLITIDTPTDCIRYIVNEGSITIDGVSLTIFSVENNCNNFTASIIPHTWNNTILHHKNVGDLVNLEVDILAKYVEKLIKINSYPEKMEDQTGHHLTPEWIKSKGF